MIVIGHEAVSNERGAVAIVVALHEAHTVFIVAGVEEETVPSGTAVVQVIVLPFSECLASIWHGWFRSNLPQVPKPAGG